MEPSEHQETASDADNSTEGPNDAQLEQAATDSQSALDDFPTPTEVASGIETAQTPGAGASDPWYPVVGATDPVTSAVAPVPGSETPVSSSDSPEATSTPTPIPAPPASAAEGPVWPTGTPAPASAGVDAANPAETTRDEPPEAGAPVAAVSAIGAAETPAATEIPTDGTEATESVAAEAAAPAEDAVSEADAFAASSGAWPEPPTPWVDTGAIAAVGAAVGATDTSPVPSPDEVSTPDVSDLPTAINAPQTETPQVDTPPPPLDEPPAYTPPPPPVYAAPPQPAAGYAAPLQPVASAYVAPQARPQNNTPVIVEAILAFFGIYGVGWLISGETSIGIALLIAGFVWDAIFVAAAITVLGLCCVVPLQLIFVALSAFQLNNRLRMRA
ncbi:MAG TPA: hypothetical protein VH349_08695 [Ktedonobacterales bacterium]